MLARGYKRQLAGLPVRGEGVREKITNVFKKVGGVLLKKGSKHLAKTLKKSDNPIAKVSGTVIGVAGEGVGDALADTDNKAIVPMDTTEKPVNITNTKNQPIAVKAPQEAIPPQPDPILATPAPVNPVNAQSKTESIHKGNPTVPPVVVSSPKRKKSKQIRVGKRKRGKVSHCDTLCLKNQGYIAYLLTNNHNG